MLLDNSAVGKPVANREFAIGKGDGENEGHVETGLSGLEGGPAGRALRAARAPRGAVKPATTCTNEATDGRRNLLIKRE